MKIEPKIFKAYDIRGLASNEITTELAERVGRAMVEYTGADVLVVGRDMRQTSPELANALIKGIVSSGADIVDIGLASTPLFYYAIGMHAAPGVMVTASHNPKGYNGFKLERSDVSSIGAGSGMEKIRDLVVKNEFADRAQGNIVEIDMREEYVARHLAIVPRRDIGSPAVVWDAGNGMAGHDAPAIIKAYGLEKKGKKLFFELDGAFPNHVPNPVEPENLVALIDAVRKQKAGLGVAFDGDADRVGFVDENGAPVRGDLVTALIAAETLRARPGAAVVYDVRSSNAVREAIAASGGKPVVCKVGHSFIKAKMRETDACVGGEYSMHYYFKDMFFAESSDLAVLMILKAMKRTGKKLSELVAPLLRYFHSGEINFEAKDKEAVIKRLEDGYASRAKDVLRIDGLRCDFDSWWFSVRASNTEPLVRLNLEAKSRKEMDAKVGEVSKLINET